MRQDEEIGKRFAQFRAQFIAKNQTDAAKILQVGQATVSRLEMGTTPISMDILAILIKHYYLNIDWLLTGKGKIQDKTETKNTTVTDVTAMKGDMQLILKQLKLLQSNYTYTVNRMNDRIAGLEKQLQAERERG